MGRGFPKYGHTPETQPLEDLSEEKNGTEIGRRVASTSERRGAVRPVLCTRWADWGEHTANPHKNPHA